MANSEMPIFVRIADLLLWLVPQSQSFSRAYRQTFTQRLLHAAFDLNDRLHEANIRQEQEHRVSRVFVHIGFVPPELFSGVDNDASKSRLTNGGAYSWLNLVQANNNRLTSSVNT